MLRVSALLLFTLGYALMALFEPTASALPAFATFLGGGVLLVRRQARRDDACESRARGLR